MKLVLGQRNSSECSFYYIQEACYIFNLSGYVVCVCTYAVIRITFDPLLVMLLMTVLWLEQYPLLP